MYYKRNDSFKCKGPGTVLGQERQKILVKHGGVYVRVHPCRLLHKACQKQEAQKQELDSWKSNYVSQDVPDFGQHALSVRWVITENTLYDKNCLVARGLEEQEVNLKTDSLTCSREGLRIVLSIIASNSWKCRSIDIKVAFLEGSQIERDVYLRPPPEADQPKKTLEVENLSLWIIRRSMFMVC